MKTLPIRLAPGADLRAALNGHGAAGPTSLSGGYEILTLGCIVRSTAEILLALLPEYRFWRRFDPATGYPELEIGDA